MSRFSKAASRIGGKVQSAATNIGQAVKAKARNIGQSAQLGVSALSGGVLGMKPDEAARSQAAGAIRRQVKRQAGAGQIDFTTDERI